MKNISIYQSNNISSSILSKCLKLYFFIFFCWIFLYPNLSYAINFDDIPNTSFEKKINITKDILKTENGHIQTCELEVCICNIDDSLNVEGDEMINFVVTYRVDIIPTWNSESPAWPDEAAHFSWIGGANHNSNVKFWEVGTLASQGIDLLSVTGNTRDLVSEVQTEISNNNAENLINIQHWFCPDGITHQACGELSFEIDVSEDFPLVTLASMLGPSPDWFIGVESLSMVDGDGLFIPKITYELYPYDAGILSDNSVLIGDCCGREPLSVPQENIHLITTESGETIGPGSLGQIVFTAISPTLTIGTSELLNSVIEIYPNPVSRNLHIQTELLDFQISIFNLKGSLLYMESNKSLIDVTQFSNGLYLLEITDKKTKNKLIKKIVVEK